MANRKTKPTSPARRFATYPLREDFTGDPPNKRPDQGQDLEGGRNAHGRVTSRHRGGGAKRRYREIDFKRRKDGVPAKVASIEYDPTARATSPPALRGRRQELHPRPQGVRPRRHGRVRPQRRYPAGQRAAAGAIPTGTIVHNVELNAGQGGRLGRAAGSAIQVAAKEPMVTLRLPSSEMRLVRGECRATVAALERGAPEP